jgi:hypothetical protein
MSIASTVFAVSAEERMTQAADTHPPRPPRQGEPAARKVAQIPWSVPLLAVGVGAALRLAWPADIEYKGDETWIFEHARGLVQGAPWPWSGMPTSIGPPNAGLSVWVFGVLAYLSGATTPPELARAVQLCNIAALVAFAVFARCVIAERDRESWFWATALWAVNPVAVILERKIWLPSVLPLPGVIFIITWWYRRNPAAAFVWGLVGALMSQIHIAVSFFAIAVAAWTCVYDRKTVSWKGWFAGSVIGSLSAIPWLIGFAGTVGAEAGSKWRFPNFTFYLRWATQPFGFGITYSLGRSGIVNYLRGPWLGGEPTYFMGLVFIVLVSLLTVTLIRAFWRAATSCPPTVRGLVLGNGPAQVLINAALWGYGLALTLLTIGHADSSRHYLVVVAPVMALWAARLVLFGDGTVTRRSSRAVLAAFCIASATAAAGCLYYIHEIQIVCAEYGQTWGSQDIQPHACVKAPRVETQPW